MITVKEEIRLTVHYTIVFMAMQLTNHLAKSLQSDGTHKFKKTDKERYLISICFILGAIIPNISTTINDPKESSEAMQYAIQNYDNFLARGKGTIFPSLKIKFSDADQFSDENTETIKWYVSNWNKNDKKNPLNICFETGMEGFFLFADKQKKVVQESPMLGSSIYKKDDLIVEGFHKLVEDEDIKIL